MHNFYNGYNLNIISLILVISSMSFWFRDIISEGTYLGNHTLSVQKGLNLGVILFIVSEALFFLAIFWAFFHRNALWLGTKLRGHLKALITKLYIEKYIVASLMTGGIVTSLEILDLNQGIGNRGSKSDSLISVKEQRADGSSILKKYCKVCSRCQGNLVFIHSKRKINTSIFSSPLSNLGLTSYHKSYFSSKAIIHDSSALALNPYYVTGFTDGEGCFFIGLYADSNYKMGYRVKASFQIGLHEKDLPLLEQIQSYFGVGKITKLGAESVQFRVTSLEDLNVILKQFDAYPLLTRKQSDYLLFKEVINLMKEGKHLTLEGLNRIVSIKTTLNDVELSDTLRSAFSNIEPALRPASLNSKIQDLHWLAGFTDAEGCFFIPLKKSPESKLGETVWLKFLLTQHTKDKELLESLMSELNCGRYIAKPGYGEFVVEKFSDIWSKIIPIFEEYKLQGIKSKNYEDFKQAAILIKQKAHLTREGLDKIKEIKGGMNKKRK
jgi:hypothetical protein